MLCFGQHERGNEVCRRCAAENQCESETHAEPTPRPWLVPARELPSTETRLRRALASYGWGPREGPVEFHHRPYVGWQLGNGTVQTPWPDPALIPSDAETALRDIEADLRKEAPRTTRPPPL